MAEKLIGRIGYVYRGTYDPTRAYDKLDTVYDGGATYQCVTPCTGKKPSESPDFWAQMSASASLIDRQAAEAAAAAAAQDREAAQQAKTDAETAKDTAVDAKNTAISAKETAVTKAGEASASAGAAAESAQAAQQAADSVDGEALMAAIDGKVSKSGDTMTGALDAPTIKEGGIELGNKYLPQTALELPPQLRAVYDNRENLLINSAFELSEELGGSSRPLNTGNYVYFKDMWRAYGTGSITLLNNYASLKQQTGYDKTQIVYFKNRTSLCVLSQPVEELMTANTKSAYYTASCWVYVDEPTDILLCDQTHSVPIATWTFISTTFAAPSSPPLIYAGNAGFRLDFQQSNRIAYVGCPMLVRGDKPGVWVYPDKTFELQRERRYYYRIDEGFVAGENIIGWGKCTVDIPSLKMRIVPTVRTYSPQIYQNNVGWVAATSVSAQQNKHLMKILCDAPANMVNGPVIFQGLIELDARYY